MLNQTAKGGYKGGKMNSPMSVQQHPARFTSGMRPDWWWGCFCLGKQ